MNSNLNTNSITSIQNISSIKTLSIIEAAKLLGAHKETIRRMAAQGELPAAKIGRSWRFVEHDLINHLRAQYSSITELSVNNINRSTTTWASKKGTTFGGSTSQSKENEYAKVLGLK